MSVKKEVCEVCVHLYNEKWRRSVQNLSGPKVGLRIGREAPDKKTYVTDGRDSETTAVFRLPVPVSILFHMSV